MAIAASIIARDGIGQFGVGRGCKDKPAVNRAAKQASRVVMRAPLARQSRNRHPVLKDHAMIATHSARKPSVMPKASPIGTSEVP